ncbi:flagellar export chaperone FliS [Anaeropeptidivorans aminofermentans]|jgi:flagellar protein FliS|uniref:flagellar export chaperone FliS n=1 Tax=Anaeropeptidivorans aminofermentans TaxID=2934315 RepID=UPI002024865E|nr:flagellar export chaperone FliS [Anaeropeptidivorans aminofermentans]MBE6012799.1 flagellar export chaperone FliS [Lachnospiraceae bacterium]
MAIRNPYSSYANNSIETASPEELTLKLYEGAVKFCNQAIIAIENKDLDKANETIIKVQNIIREFQITLDMQYEVSKGLALMYDYLHRRLIEANMQKSIEILEEVRGFLRDLRDTWKQAMVLAKQK